MHLQDVEKLEHEDLVIYWFGDEKREDVVGVCFRPCVTNIANQSLAESMVLANEALTDEVYNMDSPEDL